MDEFKGAIDPKELQAMISCLTTIAVLLLQAPPSNYPWGAYDPDAYLLMGVKSSVFAQQYQLIQGGQQLTRTRQERMDPTSEWLEEREEYTVSYYLTKWCGREGGDDIFLCGVKPSGESIIERWRFNVPVGRWVVAYGNTPPLGTPAGDYNPTITVKGGGSWRNSKVKAFPPSPTKSLIYEGTQGPFTAAAVDPEGRQLFLYDYTSKSIARLVLTNPQSTIETLYDDSAYPQLSQISSIDVRDFGSEGRKILTRKQYTGGFVASQEVYGIFSDSNNDGSIDSVSFLDRTMFDASPYRTWSNWQEFWRLE